MVRTERWEVRTDPAKGSAVVLERGDVVLVNPFGFGFAFCRPDDICRDLLVEGTHLTHFHLASLKTVENFLGTKEKQKLRPEPECYPSVVLYVVYVYNL